MPRGFEDQQIDPQMLNRAGHPVRISRSRRSNPGHLCSQPACHRPLIGEDDRASPFLARNPLGRLDHSLPRLVPGPLRAEQRSSDRIRHRHSLLDHESPFSESSREMLRHPSDQDSSTLQVITSDWRNHRRGGNPNLPDLRPQPFHLTFTEQSPREHAGRSTIGPRCSAQSRQHGPHGIIDLSDRWHGHESGNPRTLHRPGVLRPSIPCKTRPSLVRITRSPFPAPSRSKASTGSPSSRPSVPSSCTTINRSP